MDSDAIRKLGHLSRLKLNDEEVEQLGKEIEQIIDYMKTLDDVDTENVEPLSHVQGSQNIFRKDEEEPAVSAEEFLRISPDSSGTFIRVPIIIDDGGGSA